MGWHALFDPTERLFTRGQKALARRDFTGAEALLRATLARDPGYAHVELYLAHALAEQERLADAETAFARGIALAPQSFVFPLHLAIVRLDAGNATGARAALATAVRLAPDNPLVLAYLDLMAWDGGRAEALVALAGRVHDLPESFRARLLLRLASLTLAARGARAALALLEPPPDPPLGIGLPAWLRARWRRRRLARAERLLGAGRCEAAADSLASRPDVLEEPGAAGLLERARRGAVDELTAALAKVQGRDRRGLLLRRYELENDLGERDAAYGTLEAWLAAYTEAGASSGERPVAEAAARRLAEIDLERGAWERALRHCADSRAARPSRETAGVEGLALVALGRSRPARHRFEDFLADALFPVELSVARALESSA
jgi:tetratricopeptide (TPR) repeat protein